MPLITAFTAESERIVFRVENMKIGLTNNLDYTTQLIDGTWSQVTNFTAGWISTNIAVPMSSTATTRFYRVTVQSP